MGVPPLPPAGTSGPAPDPRILRPARGWQESGSRRRPGPGGPGRRSVWSSQGPRRRRPGLAPEGAGTSLCLELPGTQATTSRAGPRGGRDVALSGAPRDPGDDVPGWPPRGPGRRSVWSSQGPRRRRPGLAPEGAGTSLCLELPGTQATTSRAGPRGPGRRSAWSSQGPRRRRPGLAPEGPGRRSVWSSQGPRRRRPGLAPEGGRDVALSGAPRDPGDDVPGWPPRGPGRRPVWSSQGPRRRERQERRNDDGPGSTRE